MINNLERLELRLRCRNIVYVLDYFDEEHTFPWNYVQRDGQGGFELFTTVLVKQGEHEEAIVVSLGPVANPREAMSAVHWYENWTVALDRLSKRGSDGVHPEAADTARGDEGL